MRNGLTKTQPLNFLMPYCSECGKEIRRGAKFCPECGAQQNADSPLASPSMPRIGPRTPLWAPIRAVSIVEILYGALLLVFAGFTLFAVVSMTALALALANFLGGGLVTVFSGYGILRSAPWSPLVGTLAGIVLLVVGVLFALTPDVFFAVFGVLGIVLGVSSLVLLHSPASKRRLRSQGQLGG